MERFLHGIGTRKDSEKKIDIGITPVASTLLSQLVRCPNPNLEEFAFLGLGQGSLVDRVLIVDRTDLEKQGLRIEKGSVVTGVGKDEIRLLFQRLGEIEERFDILVLGHLHPSGQVRVNGKLYYLAPSEALLEPSMGRPEEGGPAGSSDLGFYKELYEKAIKIPFMGIAANTEYGPRLRLYKTDKLIKIKGYNDMYHVPQLTIDL